MRQRVLILTGSAVAMLSLALLSGCSKKAPEGGRKDRGVPVTVSRVLAKPVPVEIKTFGTVEPFATVSIRAQVSDILLKVHFQKGQNIQKDQLLFTIDPRASQLALEQAQAVLAKDTALALNAEQEMQRDQDLLKKGISSPSDYEKMQLASEVAKAAIQADKAAIANATLQLEHCQIRSPIDGKTGNVLVNEGNLVTTNDNEVLMTINQVHPVELVFSIPQSDLAALRRCMALCALVVQAVIPGEDEPEVGELTFLDNAIDKTTGSVQLRGTFANEKERLWPGQYVQVTLVLEVQDRAIVVPDRAIQTGRDGKFVFVVKPDRTAEARPVTVGRKVGSDVVVEKGLSADEVVVTDGQLKLVNGGRVEPQAASSQPAGSTTLTASGSTTLPASGSTTLPAGGWTSVPAAASRPHGGAARRSSDPLPGTGKEAKP